MTDSKLRGADLHVVRVTPRTCWTFLRLHTEDGCTGEGEATLIGQEKRLLAAAERFVPLALHEADLQHPDAFAQHHAADSIHEAGIISAIDQAQWSIYSQLRDESLAQTLGQQRDRLPVYANINRRTRSRSPQGFADSARIAMAAGHVAFKLAPFDEVNPKVCAQNHGVTSMQAGLARIAAVREVIGKQARLMVDCHWRFDEATAVELNEAAARLGVYWIETPLPEIAENIAALVRLRRQCNVLGMRQAGLETSVGWASMQPYCEAGAYDVVMPDIKYIGGIFEMQRTVDGCVEFGVQVSPHNPSGPICHAASLQVSAVVDAFDMLELQFDESPLFDSLVATPFAPVTGGYTVLPSGSGLGVSLLGDLLEQHADQRSRSWQA